MTKRVLFFIFQHLDRYPPSIAQICTLRDMGVEVAVLTTGCDAPARELMAEKGVSCRYFDILEYPNKKLQKVMNFFNYRRAIRSFLREFWTENSVLWLGTEQTAIKMWPFVRNIHPCILSALEFYEYEWYQQGMKKIAPKVDVLTACEPTRAQYMVDWWGLPRRPYVLRNKPYGAIPPRGSGSTLELREAIQKIRGKKVLLYQGGIFPERDLTLLAKALAAGDSGYYLVLAGYLYEDGDLDALYRIYDKTIYLGYFPAPSHLELTPYATAAVTYYRGDCINTRYCAPNKIYEYAGCGVPMLCNDLPGLAETVGKAGAGECVDFADSEAVLAALKRIDENRESYCRAALDFYKNTDNGEAMAQIAEDAFSRTKAAKG